MSDGAYALVMALSALGYAAVLFLRWRQGRILKRLLESLERDGKLDELREIMRKEKERESK